MKIGDFEIGSEPFIIAETSLNHQGSVEMAFEMIDVAKAAGADCVKFQTYRTEEFCRPADPLFETFKQCELPREAWPAIKRFCDRTGVMFLSTPQNRSDLDLLLPLGMQAIKVGSDDAANLDLVKDYAWHGLPLLISTGMCDDQVLDDLWESLWSIRATDRYVRMICTSQYPTPPAEVNVNRLLKPHRIVQGFSDHTIGNTASIMAVALGACVFEKHFTLDKTLPGPDHAWACDPYELRSWVTAIREAWVMRGTGEFDLSEREAEQRKKYQRRSGEQLRGEA